MVISNLRGYLMDCTSDFDFICRTVSEYYFIQLNDEQQIEILQKAEEYIHTQYKSENEKFIKINKKYKNDKSDINLETLSGISSYSEIVNKDERKNLLHRVFNSLESVIVVRDKFRLMALILQMNDIEKYPEIFSIDKNNFEKNDKYFNAVIKHRNALAHNKLKYGDKCKNRIKIIRTLEDIDCNCKDNECGKSYSYDDCKTLRESIYNYYSLFNPLLESITHKSEK
jgi:hypothetical protein